MSQKKERLRTVSRDYALKEFLSPLSISLLKPDDMNLKEFAEWISSFHTYLANEHMTIMVKPLGDSYEFHISSTPSSSKEDIYNTAISAFSMFKGKSLITLVATKFPNVSNYLTKRFNFTKGEEVEPVTYDGKEYKQYYYYKIAS